MPYLDQLPGHIANFILTRFIAEFATVSSAGVPLDTPLVPFNSADFETIDSTTGLAYPIKAERARRNPKVGMLFEGGIDEPVVLLSGMAAVKDTDFQSNLERYLSEQILTIMLDPAKTDYETVTRQAIWYFTRILICVKPHTVRWWERRSAMDDPPSEWRAADGIRFPQSDPAPPGVPSKAEWRESPPWRDVARGALARRAPAHLTMVDAEGFPLPVRAKEIHLEEEGFRLVMPAWLPWSEGKATVTFQGLETFIGEAHVHGTEAFFRAKRSLPLFPLLTNPDEILKPRPETKAALMARIHHELDRRAARLPCMPDQPPEPTAGARMRAEVAFSFAGLDGADG